MIKPCTSCILSNNENVKTVCMSSFGNPLSEFFIVFDRPSYSEDLSNSSFSGKACNLFKSLLKKANLDPTKDTYLTYITKCALPKEATKEEKSESASTCKDIWLKKEILKWKPKVVLAVGGEVLGGLLPDQHGIIKSRGVFFDAEIEGHKFKVLPTFAPAYLLNNHSELESVVIADIKRAYGGVKNGVSCWFPGKEKTLNYKTVSSIKDMSAMFDEIREKKIVACDIESRSLNPYKEYDFITPFPLVSIQFSTEEGTGWFLPIAHQNFIEPFNIRGMAWSGPDWDYLKTELRYVFESGEVFVIGHNFKFDSKFIKEHIGITVKLSFDTMLAHGLIGDTSNSLKKIAWEITDLGGYEEEQSKYTESLSKDRQWDMFYYPYDQLALYGCCDVDVTIRLFNQLNERFASDAKDQLPVFKLLMKASRSFLEIEHAGIKVDTDYLHKLGNDLDYEGSTLVEEFKQKAPREIAEIDAELLVDATGKSGKLLAHKSTEFNIDSSSDISNLFYTKLGFKSNPKLNSRKTSDPSVGRLALEELAEKHPIAGILLKYRKISKQKSGFVDAYPQFLDSKGFIHPTYSLIKYFDEDGSSGTVSGRLACVAPNLQQVPSRDEGKRIKKLFLPDFEDHVLCDMDYSAIEVRVAAMCTQDPLMRSFFNDKLGDFHTLTAAKIYDKKPEDITKPERTNAKTVNFAALYGAGPNKMASLMKISNAEAQAFLIEYWKVFPGLKKWILEQKAFAQRNLYVKSLFGRIRRLPDANSKDEFLRESALKRAINSPIQSDASDLTLHSLNRIHAYLKTFNHANSKQPSRLCGSVHDSILLSIHKDDLYNIAKEIKFKILENVDLDFIRKKDIMLLAEVSAGPNWGATAPITFEE